MGAFNQQSIISQKYQKSWISKAIRKISNFLQKVISEYVFFLNAWLFLSERVGISMEEIIFLWNNFLPIIRTDGSIKNKFR